MRTAFLIDQSRCIGCHACSVACKAEHDVPLGSYRTWVKHVEKGTFPDVRRYFTVLRCNHCEEAPCVEICPVTALFVRPDGIVDFDRDVCIGCKACMQACPYDALYIHPDRGTAEKCNFCAHRVDVGLEPPCATVCPAEAILVGDLDDPSSRVAQLVATRQVDVRKPEKGTRPKVFYIDAEPRALTPGATDTSGGYVWAEKAGTANPDTIGAGSPDDAFLTGVWAGLAPARTVYDVGHEPAPWGWKVSGYLWTKSVSAGAFLVAALAGWLGVAGNPAVTTTAPAVGLLFLLLTSVLLVADLKRPERFWTILTRPNWTSWLARGAFVLMAFGLLGTAWALAIWTGGPLSTAAAPVAAAAGVLAASIDPWRAAALQWLRWPLVAAAAAAAGYSGYLFAQAKGRDFWQSPALPLHLVVQALAAGAATLILPAVLGPALAGSAPGLGIGSLGTLLAAALALHLGLVVFGEVGITHATGDAARAARDLVWGRQAGWFWASVGLCGGAAAALLAVPAAAGVAAVAAVAALAGLAAYEHAWVMAGQSVPLS